MLKSIIWVSFISAFAALMQDTTPSYAYDLARADRIMKLNSDLREISGLSYFSGKLFAVQDEKGKIFMLNPVTGKVMDEQKFWDRGDYEACEVAGDSLFVIQSDGDLFVCPIGTIEEDSTKKFDLGFGSKWNFEAMGYDSVSNALIIIAKHNEAATQHEVFSLPMRDITAVGQPRYIIQDAEIWHVFKNSRTSIFDRVAEPFVKATYTFNPSAVAVHPGNGEIYVLSSPVPQIAIFRPDWTLRKVIALDAGRFPQPEAICFDDRMNLYIANEGPNTSATILMFSPQ